MFKLKYRLQEEVNPEGGEGGGGEAPKTYTQEELDAALKGLKDSRDALLTEKKQTAAKAKEAEEARLKAEQEASKKAGELDKFEESLRSEFEKERGGLNAKLEALTAKVTGESKKAILGSFSGDFINTESLDLVAQLVKTEFDGTDVKTQFTDFAGNVITTDPAEFKKWMGNHPAISHLMKADAASGGGAGGNRDPNGGAKGSQQKFTNPVDAKRAELKASLDEKFK
jgi:hypothetical protein